MERLGPVFLLATVFAASVSAGRLDDLRRLARREKPASSVKAATAGSKLDSARTVLVTAGDVALPFLVNGTDIRTRVRLINMESREVEWELLFADDNGNPVEMDIAEQGVVSSVKGRLAPFGVAVIATSGTGNEQVTWGFVNAPTGKVAVSASVELNETNGVFGSTYPAMYIADKKVRAVFDNEEGADTEVSFINFSLDPVTVDVVVRDADGRQLLATTRMLPGLGAAGFDVDSATPEAAGIKGSVEFSIDPNAQGGVGIVSVQFYEEGGFTLLPGYSIVE